MGVKIVNGRLYFGFHGGHTAYTSTNATQIKLNEWQHIVIVGGDKSETEFYINGVRQEATNNGGWPATVKSGYNAVIGMKSDGSTTNGGYFKGAIDEVRVYNYALNEADIKGLYNNVIENPPSVNETNVSNPVCQDLIDMVKNPMDFSAYNLNYIAQSWNFNYSGSWWINGKLQNYTEYYSSWFSKETYNQNFGYTTSLDSRVVVFDDKSVDLTNWMKDLLSSKVCTISTYIGYSGEVSYYTCVLGILEDTTNLEANIDRDYTQAIWFNDNVIVTIEINFGQPLTDEEVSKMSQKRGDDFLNDLKDNDGTYFWSHSDFDLTYSGEMFVRNSIKKCSSDVEEPLREGTNYTCYSSWKCKIEPVVCPPHGSQTRTCVDIGCNSEKRVQELYCSPGICSGCYVPRWFGDEYGDNKCIPYGFRFEQERSVDIEEAEEGYDHGYDTYLEINDDYSAYFKFGESDGSNWEWIAFEGDVHEGNLYTFSDPYYNEEYQFRVKEIIPSSGEKNGKIVLEFIDTINAYCDIDGEVRKQRTVDYQGDWATCQNNYECESNICSSGECIELQKLLGEASELKQLGVKVLCKLAHLFSLDNYNTCIYNFLGEEEDPQIKTIDLRAVANEETTLLEKSSTKLHVGDSIDDVITTSITDGSPNEGLPNTLADGIYTDNDNDDFDYTQKLDLGEMRLNEFSDRDYKDGELTMGIRVATASHIMNYTLDFTDQPLWSDIPFTFIEIMGKTYFILDYKNGTKLTLLESAGVVNLKEDEKAIVKTNNGEYTVSIEFIGASNTRLKINNEVTNTLSVGMSQKLSDGTYVGIKEINTQDYAGGVKIVDFIFGTQKIELTSGSDIQINGDSFSGLKAILNTSGTSSGDKITAIKLQWDAADDCFATGTSEIIMQGFKSIKLGFLGLIETSDETYGQVYIKGVYYTPLFSNPSSSSSSGSTSSGGY